MSGMALPRVLSLPYACVPRPISLTENNLTDGGRQCKPHGRGQGVEVGCEGGRVKRGGRGDLVLVKFSYLRVSSNTVRIEEKEPSWTKGQYVFGRKELGRESVYSECFSEESVVNQC